MGKERRKAAKAESLSPFLSFLYLMKMHGCLQVRVKMLFFWCGQVPWKNARREVAKARSLISIASDCIHLPDQHKCFLDIIIGLTITWHLTFNVALYLCCSFGRTTLITPKQDMFKLDFYWGLYLIYYNLICSLRNWDNHVWNGYYLWWIPLLLITIIVTFIDKSELLLKQLKRMHQILTEHLALGLWSNILFNMIGPNSFWLVMPFVERIFYVLC